MKRTLFIGLRFLSFSSVFGQQWAKGTLEYARS